jgi:hypothetical protein
MKNLALFSLYIDRFFKTAIPEGVYSYHRLLLSAPFYLAKQRERHTSTTYRKRKDWTALYGCITMLMHPGARIKFRSRTCCSYTRSEDDNIACIWNLCLPVDCSPTRYLCNLGKSVQLNVPEAIYYTHHVLAGLKMNFLNDYRTVI